MQTVVLIKKNGTIVEKRVKSFAFEHVYKYTGTKSSNGFQHLHTWKIKKGNFVHIFGKREGRSNNINKMELPPPIDTPIFYGTLCLVKSGSKKRVDVSDVTSYSAEQWNKDYETLFGGFEDIGAEDSYESDELENYPKEALTKEGYLKDGFIIEGDEDNNDNYVGSDGTVDTVETVGSDYYEDEDDDGSELEEEDYDSEDEQ